MVKATWLGHSAVLLEGSRTVVIDPFLTGNPCAACPPDAIKKADLVVVTHHHGDHLGDAYALCRATGATLVAMHEIAVEGQERNLKAEGMNIGGTVEVAGVKVHMVSALHSAEKGSAAGVVVEMDGRRIYHAGDTGLTLDMQLVGEFFRPDLSFLPIGDRYTMGPASAAKAVEWIKTKKVVPVHYGTFPLVAADPEEFKKKVGSLAEVVILEPGRSVTV
ncbi:MAG: metal-dependent hydrolase [Candidatus Aminicenantes bacterium]|nr:metal-dependent hydrolase [Candidatus Aminicenantes bacterium]